MYLKINSYQNKLKILDHKTIKKILFESLWTSDIDYEKLPKNLNALSFKISIEVQN